MVKEIELSIPQSWEDITLKKYLNLMNELKNYEGEDEAQFAVMLQILCGLDAEYLKGISIADYNLIKNELNNFIGSMDSTLHRFITIDGVEYGFEPNLSEMAYGAYVDITQYSEIAINDNWAKIMNILYRPVTSKNSIYYTIETYTGDYNYEKWLNVSMDKHFGALFFVEFINGLGEKYPELFDGDGFDSKHQAAFAKKWGSYSTIYQLADGDILKYDKIVEEPLAKCLLYLAYISDKNKLEGMLHSEVMQKYSQ
jgi:hypothetical protein